MQVCYEDGNTVLRETEHIDIALTLDCGQAFRWQNLDDGCWQGVAMGKYLKLKQEGTTITLFDTTLQEYEDIWSIYFDMKRDYKAIIDGYTDPFIATACKEYPGIRILKQNEWEAICSFIISANNNIPRIKGIISRFCEMFGEPVGKDFTFPEAECVAQLTVEDLAPIRAGFRAKYIIDAAQKISSRKVDIEKIRTLPFEEAKQHLLQIKGVGEKVAQCSLLYGFARMEAFPRDVWVKRIEEELYPDGFPQKYYETQGIAQQYLFHWRRKL